MSWKETCEAVRARAQDRCEYCGMDQSLQGGIFHIEHVVPVTRGGNSELDNLALACIGCNLHKSDRVEGIDPMTTEPAPLFNPRRQLWADHFCWDEYQLEGKTATGRATIESLQLNSERRVFVRQAEMTLGLFPPNL